jgi:hypothetical protein
MLFFRIFDVPILANHLIWIIAVTECGIARCFVFVFTVNLRLRAIPPSVKLKSKIVLPTPRYAAKREVDSALCRIAGEWRLSAMQHDEESIFVVEPTRISLRIRIYIQNRFSP